MKHARKWTAFLLLVAGLILVNVIAALLPWQVDLTADKLYTLSPGSRAMLAQLDEPVTLEFHFSRSLEGLPIQFKNYAGRVEALLRQYENAARGNLRLRVVNPRPDTPEEEQAIRAGIPGRPLPNGETLFFGLRAIQADQEEVIEMFTRQREDMLEYDISRLIHQVRMLDRPRLGILSSLPVIGTQLPPGMGLSQQSQDWVFVQELRQYFDIEHVRGDRLPEGLDVLAVIHPRNLSEEMQYEIDQYLLSGRPLFLAVDPSSFVQKSQANPQQMMMGQQEPTHSDLPRLFEAWGIRYSPQDVVGDSRYAAVVGTGQGGTVRYPVWLELDRFNRESPPTAQLDRMLLPEPGYFTIAENGDLEKTPLITSSEESGTLFRGLLDFPDPEQVARQLTPDGQSRVIAGLVRGTFRSAFPDGRPAGEEDEESPEAPPDESFRSSGRGTLVLAADTDFLADDFSVRRVNFLGMQAVTPINDNLAFTSNVLEFLAGSDDLISIRGKGASQRPFERVRRLEAAAEERYQEQLAALETRLQEIQRNLNELQTRQREEGRLVASPEIRETIEDFRIQEAGMRAERREIRRKLREDVERLKLGLTAFNLVTMPLLTGIGGLAFFVVRTQRQKR